MTKKVEYTISAEVETRHPSRPIVATPTADNHSADHLTAESVMRDGVPSEYRCYTPPPAGQWIISGGACVGSMI